MYHMIISPFGSLYRILQHVMKVMNSFSNTRMKKFELVRRFGSSSRHRRDKPIRVPSRLSRVEGEFPAFIARGSTHEKFDSITDISALDDGTESFNQRSPKPHQVKDEHPNKALTRNHRYDLNFRLLI